MGRGREEIDFNNTAREGEGAELLLITFKKFFGQKGGGEVPLGDLNWQESALRMCSPSGTYCSCAIKKITIKLELILTLKNFFTKMGRGREEIDFNNTSREGRGQN